MKPESWSGQFPPKSSPTFSYWWYLPSRVNQLDVPLPVQITSGSPVCGGGIPTRCLHNLLLVPVQIANKMWLQGEKTLSRLSVSLTTASDCTCGYLTHLIYPSLFMSEDRFLISVWPIINTSSRSCTVTGATISSDKRDVSALCAALIITPICRPSQSKGRPISSATHCA
jgi:hypothetical protein